MELVQYLELTWYWFDGYLCICFTALQHSLAQLFQGVHGMQQPSQFCMKSALQTVGSLLYFNVVMNQVQAT